MICMDHGATSFPKPPEVRRAVAEAMVSCSNPGRGGYAAARKADRVVYACREEAAELFDCLPEQVVFTMNCTHGLHIALRDVVRRRRSAPMFPMCSDISCLWSGSPGFAGRRVCR